MVIFLGLLDQAVLGLQFAKEVYAEEMALSPQTVEPSQIFVHRKLATEVETLVVSERVRDNVEVLTVAVLGIKHVTTAHLRVGVGVNKLQQHLQFGAI